MECYNIRILLLVIRQCFLLQIIQTAEFVNVFSHQHFPLYGKSLSTCTYGSYVGSHDSVY